MQNRNGQLTLSVIKTDIGSIGGHICPSRNLLETVRGHIAHHGKDLLTDSRISHTGDDIAILMSHHLGVGNASIHRLAWDAFLAGTQTAKAQGLYGAGQDLLKNAFSGNVRGKVSRKAIEMRRQGFFGAAMLPMQELEYTGIMEKLERLQKLFKVRQS
jgi:fructose 1,6-bisphosphatase